jgi:hypothetical protein
MQPLLSLFCFLMITTLISACGPVYQSHYTYAPPHAAMEKKCVAQCLQGKNSCLRLCDLKNQRCVERAHYKGLERYTAYKQEQLRNGKAITKSVSYFEDRSVCRKACSCTISFNTCYSACGGQVKEHKKCVAFCDKK